MAKELPYFRFTCQEWQNGDISLEEYHLKGLFIDVCSYYWVQDCSITLAMLNKRFRNAIVSISELIELNIIKVGEDDVITIKFLDDQYDILSEKRKKRQKAGKKGGLSKASNAKAMLKQNSSYKDKDKDNSTEEFSSAVIDFSDNYMKALESKNRILKSQKNNKQWKDPIRLMIDRDGIDIEEMKAVANMYFMNFEEPYLPQCYSTKTFRSKYMNLKTALNRLRNDTQ